MNSVPCLHLILYCTCGVESQQQQQLYTAPYIKLAPYLLHLAFPRARAREKPRKRT